MTPDPTSRTPSRGGWPPEIQPKVDEYIVRLSEGGDLWEQARTRERERRERREAERRRLVEDYEYWRDEHRRLMRGGPVRRMLRALFT
ncbi:hypothetical protein FA014_07745 [Cellulomonas hominis]|uniref:Uncharacterized protein n=1 Tax=Cellulomonas hominis TaxID=156981 RepID=A0A7Z8NR28_9CELL|nr:hypothetical protein [Cellulomonas hominis]TKR24093.1 hypothetical protein FA014_07745 [Cellulomonas hominis]